MSELDVINGWIYIQRHVEEIKYSSVYDIILKTPPLSAGYLNHQCAVYFWILKIPWSYFHFLILCSTPWVYLILYLNWKSAEKKRFSAYCSMYLRIAFILLVFTFLRSSNMWLFHLSFLIPSHNQSSVN